MNVLLSPAVVLAAVLSATHGAQRRDVYVKLPKRAANAQVLLSHLNLGGLNDFILEDQARTAKGNSRRRIRQTYGGLQVVGASADIEVMRLGFMVGSVSGILAFHLDTDIPDPFACTRNKRELLTKCKTVLRDKGLAINDNEVQNLKMVKKIDFEGPDNPAKLVYEVEFYLEIEPTPSRPFFQLDACDDDLAVIRQFDKIHSMTTALRERRQEEQRDTAKNPDTREPPTGTCPSSSPAQGLGGNPKTGKITYGQNTPYCLKTEVSGTQCTMDTKYGKVIDMENGISDVGKSPVTFPCAEGYSDPVNEAYGVANDAMYHGYTVGLLYEQWYGFSALDYAPKLRVHFGRCCDNALWNGVDLSFGDGCEKYYPLVSLDAVGHEIGHGITDRFSNLYYAGQSGGINEAFSDMSGEVAELFGTGTNDWQVGREFFKGNGALRDFETPSKDRWSIDSVNDYYFIINPHHSSGVFNRAFFQLVKVQGLPLRQAYEIFLIANKVIWSERTNFQAGACGAMKAAYDLGYDVNKVKNAFAVVNISLSDCNYQEFQQTIAYGETREEVLVSGLRNPVFALEGEANTVSIDVDGNDGVPVTVSVTSDAAGADVIVSGDAPFTFNVTSAMAYYKLSASGESDISIAVTVSSSA